MWEFCIHDKTCVTLSEILSTMFKPSETLFVVTMCVIWLHINYFQKPETNERV